MEVSRDLLDRVLLINSSNFEQAHKTMPANVEKAIETGMPMLILSNACTGIVAQIEFELIQLLLKVNVDQRLTLQTHQLPAIAQELFNEFRNESIEDISVCLKRGAMGKYGEIYRLDLAVICGWMTKYLDEKYEILVNRLNAEKESPYEVSRGAKVDVMLKLMKDALGEYKDPNVVNQQRLAEQRLYARDEMKKRQEFQNHINRTASEFYQKRESVNIAQYTDDETGFYIPAENISDAEHIYRVAKERMNQK